LKYITISILFGIYALCSETSPEFT